MGVFWPFSVQILLELDHPLVSVWQLPTSLLRPFPLPETCRHYQLNHYTATRLIPSYLSLKSGHRNLDVTAPLRRPTQNQSLTRDPGRTTVHLRYFHFLSPVSFVCPQCHLPLLPFAVQYRLPFLIPRTFPSFIFICFWVAGNYNELLHHSSLWHCDVISIFLEGGHRVGKWSTPASVLTTTLKLGQVTPCWPLWPNCAFLSR